MMASVLVTGCAGFIGSHLIDKLLRMGYQVVGVDNFYEGSYPAWRKRRNLESAMSQPNFTLVEADIRDEAAMRRLFETYPLDKIVHLAALAGVLPSLEMPALYEEVNVNGTVILLQLAKEFGNKHFIFASTSAVYGADTSPPFKESEPAVKPISPYGATKRMCEIFCYTYHHLFQMPVTCLRFFTVYGPRQRPDLVIYKFARCLISGKPLPVYGDGTSLRDYTYVDDTIDGVVAAVEKPLGYEIINLGCGRPIVLMEMIDLLQESLGKKAKLQFLPMQPGDMCLTHADISKAQQLLGYEPKVPFEEGIRRFSEWFLQDWQRGA